MVLNWDDECTKALIASRMFGWQVEYRMGQRDYECGQWEESQWMYGPEQQAQWLEDAAEWNMPAEYDDRTYEGMIREACVSRHHEVKLCHPVGSGWDPVPDYPNDISAAWQVVDWMIEQGWEVGLRSYKDGKWCVSVTEDTWGRHYTFGERFVYRYVLSAPRAICEAALKGLETVGEAE